MPTLQCSDWCEFRNWNRLRGTRKSGPSKRSHNCSQLCSWNCLQLFWETVYNFCSQNCSQLCLGNCLQICEIVGNFFCKFFHNTIMKLFETLWYCSQLWLFLWLQVFITLLLVLYFENCKMPWTLIFPTVNLKRKQGCNIPFKRKLPTFVFWTSPCDFFI